ncbi:hypothetical protein TcWFU_008180 [Taenia crassiceps]|uniref:Androglobin domain-containing protein n=1 Tax=Taenia crassiceps TaxID=6207 RepID=A0ABR4Q9Y6_9CEST
MGAWRRVNVDDRIMIDDNSQPILPWLKSDDLWLPLLCKALLKVAAVDYDFASETWNLLKPLLPEWQRANKKHGHDAVQSEKSENSAPFVFVEVKKPKAVQFCKNTRGVMEADFLTRLMALPQRVLLQSRRQEPLLDPKDLPPVIAWKKVRGPPKSLKEDEEHKPIRSVLMRLLQMRNSGDGSGMAEQGTGKRPGITQELEGRVTSKMNGWFEIEDMCKFFNELQVFYNPDVLAFMKTLTVVKNAEEEAVASEERYLFVDSLNNIEVFIDYHIAECCDQDGLSTAIKIEPTDWLSPCRHSPIITLPTHNRQSVSLRMPRGRHCYRIFLETPLAVSLVLFVPCGNRERTIFELGTMGTCIQEAVKEPLKNVHNGCQFLDKFCDIARNFIDATEKNGSTASQYENTRDSFVFFLKKILPQKSRQTLERAACKNIAKLISKHSKNKGQTGIADAKFSWKVLTLDPNDELEIGDTRAENESPSTEVSGFQYHDELTYSVIRGIVAYQALFRGHFTRRILKSANVLPSEDRLASPDIQRTVRGLKYLLNCLSETTDSEKVTLLRSIQCQLGCRCLPNDATFLTRTFQTGTISDVLVKPVGCIWSAPENCVRSDIRKQFLYPLFYQTIHISEGSTRFRIHLKSEEGFARVIVIDNDSVNMLGYCMFAYVLSEGWDKCNSNWQFTCLCESCKEIIFPKMCSSFAFWEANGVLECGEDGLLFRFSLDVTLRQVISVVLKISNSAVPARLILRSSDGSKLANVHEESRGVLLMPALLLGPDSNLEECNECTEASKALEGSHSHADCKEASREKLSSTEKVDSNMTRTTSVCSYILEAYVKMDELHLSEEEMTMIEKIKEARMKEMKVDYEKTRVPPSDFDLHKAKTRVSPVRRVHSQEHLTLPSWNCRVYLDASKSEIVVLKPYGPTPAELRAVQRSWLGKDPSPRLQEAWKVRQTFILTQSPEEPIKTADFAGDKTGKAGFGIPVVDEEEYDEMLSLISCTYNEKSLAGSKILPSTNGTSLKHYSAENIHQEIWGLTHLAGENQASEMKMRKLLIQ